MLVLHVRAPGFYPSIRKRRKRKKKSSCSLTHLKMFYALTGLSPESFLLGSHCCHLLFSWWDLWLQEAIKTQPALEKAARPGWFSVCIQVDKEGWYYTEYLEYRVLPICKISGCGMLHRPQTT